MPLIKWDDNFRVNIGEFDGHHKRLIEIANELYSAKKNNENFEIIEKTLNNLIVYVVIHFEREQEVMGKHGYPELEKHKYLHVGFLEQVQNLCKLYIEDGVDVVMTVTVFLEQWLRNHIQVEDKKYGLFLNGKGIT